MVTILERPVSRVSRVSRLHRYPQDIANKGWLQIGQVGRSGGMRWSWQDRAVGFSGVVAVISLRVNKVLNS
jgi:hypothetical protein